MNKIILLGIRDLKTDEKLESNKDYGIFLVGSRLSEERMDTFSDSETEEFKYRLKISHIDSIVDLKEHKDLKVEKGKSPSQKLRFLINANLGEEEYESMINYLMSHIDGLCEDYRETLKT